MHQIPILTGTRVFPIKLGVRFRATPRISKPCVFVYPWRSGFEGVVTGCHGLSRSFSDKSTFLVRKYAFVTGCHGFVTVCHAQKVDPDKFWHIGSFNHYCCPDIQEIRQKSDKHTYIYIYKSDKYMFLGIGRKVPLWDLLCRYCPICLLRSSGYIYI